MPRTRTQAQPEVVNGVVLAYSALDEARKLFDSALINARERGVTFRELGEALGMRHQSVADHFNAAQRRREKAAK